jgi:hypothetical protein
MGATIFGDVAHRASHKKPTGQLALRMHLLANLCGYPFKFRRIISPVKKEWRKNSDSRFALGEALEEGKTTIARAADFQSQINICVFPAGIFSDQKDRNILLLIR